MNRSILSLIAHGALAVVLGLPAGWVAAASEPWSPGPALQGADWAWSAPQDFDLPGARLRLLRFAARLSPDEVARRLAQHAPRLFHRLQQSGPWLQLSGMQQGRHWLAQLGPGLGGTHGLVSSLDPHPGAAGSGFPAAAFVPPGSRRVLQVSGRSARPDTLESYDCGAPLATVAAHVGEALRRARWQPLSGAAPVPTAPVPTAPVPAAPVTAATDPIAPAPTVQATPAGALFEWIHPDGARLTVHIHPRAGSVALTFWHRPEAP